MTPCRLSPGPDTIIFIAFNHIKYFQGESELFFFSFSYLGKQFLLLSEQLFLGDAQVLQSRARLPPLQGDSFTLLQHVFHLGDVRCETEALKGCGVKAK